MPTASPKLAPPPPEVQRVTALVHLAPRFRAAVETLLEELRTAHWPPLVTETFRTHDRQAYLYGFGRRYDDGRGIVTHSQDADETWHGFGLAADIVHATQYWRAPTEFWETLGATAARLGLTWGGDWNRNGIRDERFPDRPHVQWGPPMRRSPSPRAARLVAAGGLPALWQEVGAL